MNFLDDQNSAVGILADTGLPVATEMDGNF